MLSSAKNSNRTAWLRSEPGMPASVTPFLLDYFPESLRIRLADEIRSHPLAREILATRLSSEIMDLGAPGFVGRLLDLAGIEIEDAMRSYAVVRNVFGIGDLASRIDEVADDVSWETEHRLLRRIHALLEHGTTRLTLCRQQPLDIDKESAHLSETVSAVSEHLESILPTAMREERGEEIDLFIGLGVPPHTATGVASLRPLAACFDIAEAATVLGMDPVITGAVHYEISQELRLDWLHDKIAITPGDPHWTVMAKALLRDDLGSAHRDLTVAVRRPIGIDDHERVSSWLDANHRQRQRYLDLCAEMQRTESLDVSIIQVALQHLPAIARADHATT